MWSGRVRGWSECKAPGRGSRRSSDGSAGRLFRMDANRGGSSAAALHAKATSRPSALPSVTLPPTCERMVAVLVCSRAHADAAAAMNEFISLGYAADSAALDVPSGARPWARCSCRSRPCGQCMWSSGSKCLSRLHECAIDVHFWKGELWQSQHTVSLGQIVGSVSSRSVALGIPECALREGPSGCSGISDSVSDARYEPEWSMVSVFGPPCFGAPVSSVRGVLEGPSDPGSLSGSDELGCE